ncbi:MAG: hypothetical protein IJH47_00320, partial [Oscillospiraceae bacterium]|nr:hypothetical protein [Oscillospiraceae bacterium]
MNTATTRRTTTSFFITIRLRQKWNSNHRPLSYPSGRIAELAASAVEAAGCRLWDVEYVREAGTWYLRVFVDKDGGVSIDDCEAI